MILDVRSLGTPAIFRVIRDATSRVSDLDEETVVYVNSLENGKLLKGYTEMCGFESTLSSEANRVVVRFKVRQGYGAGFRPQMTLPVNDLEY